MENQNAPAYEIERKFLVAMPDPSWLWAQEGVRCAQITQTYLRSTGEEEVRVRRRSEQGIDTFVRTAKRTLSGIKRVEIEKEITREEYAALLLEADPARRTIEKTRYSFRCAGHVVEIDIYPLWRWQAILEVELADEREALTLPKEIRILCEVTDDPRYKNAALASAEDLSAL